MRKIALLVVLMALMGIVKGLVEDSTQRLVAGEINNFSVRVGCKDCEVEILKEVEIKYKSTRSISWSSERVKESRSESREDSVADSDSRLASMEFMGEKERGYAESSRRYWNEEIQVTESEGRKNVSSLEFTRTIGYRNLSEITNSVENPQEKREIQEYSFYEEIPFVVLGPSMRKGNSTFEVYVPDGVEGAFWIPVKVDNQVEYVGVLILRLERDRVEEVEAEKATYEELGTTGNENSLVWTGLVVVGIPVAWCLKVILRGDKTG